MIIYCKSLSLSNTSWAYKICSCCLLPWWYCPPVFWLHARKWKYELFAAFVSCSCSKSHPRSAWRLPTALRFGPSSCVSSVRLPKGSETLGEQKVQGIAEASCDRSLQLQPVQCRWYCWKQKKWEHDPGLWDHCAASAWCCYWGILALVLVLELQKLSENGLLAFESTWKSTCIDTMFSE